MDKVGPRERVTGRQREQENSMPRVIKFYSGTASSSTLISIRTRPMEN